MFFFYPGGASRPPRTPLDPGPPARREIGPGPPEIGPRAPEIGSRGPETGFRPPEIDIRGPEIDVRGPETIPPQISPGPKARGPEMASRPLPGGPPGSPLLSGKLATQLHQICIFTGMPVNIPPPRDAKRPGGAAEGGARGQFQRISAEN